MLFFHAVTGFHVRLGPVNIVCHSEIRSPSAEAHINGLIVRGLAAAVPS